MNARSPLQPNITPPAPPMLENEGSVDLVEYWDIVVDSRWIIAGVTAFALAIGVAYALLTPPIYESNLLIQVEESPGSTKNLFGASAAFFDMKTPATGEIEIIRSRLVVGRAVEAAKMYIDAHPRYVPLIGGWLARRAVGLSNPGFLGFTGYVSGTERIAVSQFDVPQTLEGSQFRLTAADNGTYALSHPRLSNELSGKVGTQLVSSTPDGTISLIVTALEGKPGAQFDLVRRSTLNTIDGVQDSLKLVEKGRDSGVIEAKMQSAYPKQLTRILDAIGREYVRQNVDRKAAEAEKTLAFLGAQLPQLKKEVEQSDAAYSKFRNEKGTISLDDEAKAVLGQEVDLQSKLTDAKLRRMDLVARFTPAHPAVKTLDEQIATWNREIERLNARVRAMPAVQSNVLRLQRDVQVNNDAYQNLRNTAIQLQLTAAGKVGNVRVIDDARMPEAPVKPKKALIAGSAAVLGLLFGIALALARNAFFRGVRSPQEVEAHTGLSVYSTIPLSPAQEALAKNAALRQRGIHVLAAQLPSDPAVESLRSLRTALQFAMLDAENNRVLITGATPGVGKSFVSANFAAILAAAGKRVLLIDADLRKGHLNHYFGVPREKGLSEVIAGTLSISEAIRPNLLPNLDLVTTGILPPNPAELMMSSAFVKILNELSREYAIVVLDTPPLLVAADTVGIAPHAGTVLLVARADVTQMGELHEGARRLTHTGKAVSGVLFNAIDLSKRYYGNYGYKYGGYRYRQYQYATDQN